MFKWTITCLAKEDAPAGDSIIPVRGWESKMYTFMSQAWWPLPIISSLWMLEQEDLEF